MSYNPSNPNGQSTMANSAPVVISSDQSSIAMKGGQSATSSGSWTSGTSVNTAVTLDITNLSTVTVGLVATSTITGGVVTFEVSPNNSNWFPLTLARIDSFNVESVYTLVASTTRAWCGSVDAFTHFRVRLSTAITGTATVSIFVAAQALPIEPVVTIGQAVASNLNANVTMTPATSGGLTTYHLASAGTTNATNIKNAAGQVFGWYIYNSNTSARKVAFHNTAGTPTAGSSVFFSIVIPPSAGANVFSETGIAFSTGIWITTTTGLADSDSAAVAANDLIINIFYK